MQIKNMIDEVLRFNLDNYENWLMRNEPESKKELGSEKLSSNSKKGFRLCRIFSFEQQIFTKEIVNHNTEVVPPDVIKEREIERISEEIDAKYRMELLNLSKGDRTKNFSEMASLLGMLDHLKFLNKTHVSDGLRGDLRTIFQLSVIDRFNRIEDRLFERGYIDFNGKWQKSAPQLVGFIIALFDQKYFKRDKGKEKLIPKQGNFFSDRYGMYIMKQFQPARRKTIKSSVSKEMEFLLKDLV